MRRAYSVNFALFLLGLSPAVGFAADPATQPAVVAGDVADAQPANPDTTGTTDDGSKPRRQFGDGLARRMAQRFAPVSQSDKDEAMRYMKEHSPNRFTAIDNLPDGSKGKNNAEELAARNYLSWMQIMKEDPELYAVVQKRVGVEDQIFGLLTDLQKDGSDKADATKSKLKDQVSILVDIGLEERQLRLKRLQKTVDEQKQKLADDSKPQRREALVDERYKNILNEEKGLMPNPGAGGNGGQRVRGPHPAGDSRPPGQ